MSKSKEEAITEDVFHYFKDKNRPYSVNDVVQNIKDHGKSSIQKSIDQLVVEGKLIEKTYGKQKVYAVNQNQFVYSLDDIRQMDLRISELTHGISSCEEAIKKAENELKIITSSMTTEEASKQLAVVLEENNELQKKLEKISQNKVKVSSDDFKKVKQLRQKSASEWRKRKRMCLDMVDAIMEGYPKGKKALLDDIGIELDEVGTNIPS